MTRLRGVPFVPVLLTAGLLPALGVPIWFRNEAPFHYLLAMQASLADAWRSYTPAINRPVVRFVEWAAVHALGANATLHVVWNGVLFALFALALARFAASLFGRTAGWLAVLVLVALWNLTFYPIFNAIHGVQYPLEMLLAVGGVSLLIAGLRGDAGAFPLGLLAAGLAFFTHSMSVVVIPVVVVAFLLTHGREVKLVGPIGRFVILLLAPCALFLLPIVQASGAPGGLVERGGTEAALEFLRARLGILDALFMKPPAGPVFLWGALFLALGGAVPGPDDVRHASAPRARAELFPAVAALVLAAAIAAGLARVPGARLTIAFAALLVTSLRDRRFAPLLAWAATGAGLFMATNEWSASYARHLAVPAAVVLGGALSTVSNAVAIMLPLPGALRRRATLGWVATAIALVGWGAVFAARSVEIPILSPKLAQLDYVKDLSFAFRDLVSDTARRSAPGDTVFLYRGRAREEEMESLYGGDYLDKLQPAKFPYYVWYFKLMGRDDLVVAAAEDAVAAGRGLAGHPVLAVNAWEADNAARELGTHPEREFRRGRAVAARFAP